MKVSKILKASLLLCLVIIVGLVHAGRASAAQNWQANAGSGTGHGLVVAIKYYPQIITIDEGDSITWTVNGDAHTISFLSGATAPDPFSQQAQQPAGGSSYDGTGFVNSGVVDPGGSYSLTFAKAGTYTYNCLLHPGMSATVVVQPAGTPYPHNQMFYNSGYNTQRAHDVVQGLQLLGSFLPPPPIKNNDGSKTYFVSVGIGNGTESVMRFSHPTTIIREGDSITWTNRDPMMPHTVTIAGSDGNFTDIFTPAGGSSYDGSVFTSSGILLANNTYSLKFTKAGRYNFECLLHDTIGMKGTVVVQQKL